MAQVNAYLNFAGRCKEAMNYYKKCLGGELLIQTVGDSPMAEQLSPALKDKVLHSSLVNGELVVMATDMGRDEPVSGNTVYLCLNCDTEEEIKKYFEKLSAGGKVLDPLMPMFWGGIFGSAIDKFGVKWMFNYMQSE